MSSSIIHMTGSRTPHVFNRAAEDPLIAFAQTVEDSIDRHDASRSHTHWLTTALGSPTLNETAFGIGVFFVIPMNSTTNTSAIHILSRGNSSQLLSTDPLSNATAKLGVIEERALGNMIGRDNLPAAHKPLKYKFSATRSKFS
jgi:hypothetical protein